MVTGGFNRVNLFQQAEQGFDKLFCYNRQLSDSFEYANTMKNRSIPLQLKLEELELQSNERKTEIKKDGNQENLFSINLDSEETNISSSTTARNSNIAIQSVSTFENNLSSNTSTSLITVVANSFGCSKIYEEKEFKQKKKRKKGCKL